MNVEQRYMLSYKLYSIFFAKVEQRYMLSYKIYVAAFHSAAASLPRHHRAATNVGRAPATRWAHGRPSATEWEAAMWPTVRWRCGRPFTVHFEHNSGIIFVNVFVKKLLLLFLFKITLNKPKLTGGGSMEVRFVATSEHDELYTTNFRTISWYGVVRRGSIATDRKHRSTVGFDMTDRKFSHLQLHLHCYFLISSKNNVMTMVAVPATARNSVYMDGFFTN